MDCPSCRKPTMELINVGDINTELDRCSVCNGLWFDRHELETIMDVAVKGLKVPPGAEAIDLVCPRDGEPMYSFHYPQTQVRICMCAKCDGIWLDRDELPQIKKIRTDLREQGKLETTAARSGLIGRIVHFFETAFGDLKDELDPEVDSD